CTTDTIAYQGFEKYTKDIGDSKSFSNQAQLARVVAALADNPMAKKLLATQTAAKDDPPLVTPPDTIEDQKKAARAKSNRLAEEAKESLFPDNVKPNLHFHPDDRNRLRFG